jgi:hypothetical protein
MGRTTRLHGFDVEFEAFDLYDAHFAAFGDIGGRDSAPEFAVDADEAFSGGCQRRDHDTLSAE